MIKNEYNQVPHPALKTACEVEGDTYSQRDENMAIYDNPRSKTLIDRFPRSFRFNIFKLLFLKKKIRLLKPNFIWRLHGLLGMKVCMEIISVFGTKRSMTLIFGMRYSSTSKCVQMMTLCYLDHFYGRQICFLMFLLG